MRERLQTLLPSVLALWLVSLLAIPAVATAQSGLPPTITMHPEAAVPGASVEVTGLDFPGDMAISLQLKSASGTTSLDSAATASDGTFRQLVVLPARSVAGTWELQAQAADGTRAIYAFDPSAPVVDAAAVTATTPPPPAADRNSTGDIVFMVIVAAVLGMIGTGVLYAWRMIQAERFQPGMGQGDDLIWSDGADDVLSEPTATDEPFWRSGPREVEVPAPEVAGSGEHEAPASA